MFKVTLALVLTGAAAVSVFAGLTGSVGQAVAQNSYTCMGFVTWTSTPVTPSGPVQTGINPYAKVPVSGSPIKVAASECHGKTNVSFQNDTGWLPAADPALLRQLLAAHPNLFCELSGRESIRRIYRGDPIDEAGVLKPAWKALLEDLPDRFVIGTDVDPATLGTYAEEVRWWRGILAQLTPATAAKLAHQNAERLLKLPPTASR